MVNTGKPSPGCHACRARRVKCDTTKPQCRKCVKRRVTCPGYRDPDALRIVDETSKCYTRFSDAVPLPGTGDGPGPATTPGPASVSASAGFGVFSITPPTTDESSSPPSHTGSSSSSPPTSRNGESARTVPVMISHNTVVDIGHGRIGRVKVGGDEEEDVVAARTTARARRKQQLRQSVSSIDTSSRRSDTPQALTEFVEDHQSLGAISRSPSTPLNQQLYPFFLYNFVQTTQLPDYGYMSFLIPLMASIKPGSPLPIAFSATAMVSFVMRQKVPHLLPRAEAMYSQALEATHQAIGDPKRTRDDSTLAAVVMLITFEQLRPMKKSPTLSAGWGSHLDGAMTLLKARGREGVSSIMGRKIFHIIRHNTISRSIAYGQPVDKIVYDLAALCPQEATGKRFSELSMRAADLRATAESLLGSWVGPRHCSARLAVIDLMAACLDLEEDYAEHFSKLPLTWQAITVQYVGEGRNPPITIAEGVVYKSGRVDAYADTFICYVLDWNRSARIYLQNIRIRCHAWLLGPDAEYRYTPEWEAARALCTQLSVDIAASIPYQFGATAGSVTAHSRRGGCPAPVVEKRPRLIAGLFSMWHCFAAASSDFVPECQREFLKKALDYVAEDMGIGQAQIMSKYNLRSPSMPIKMSRYRQRGGETVNVRDVVKMEEET